MIHLPTLIYDLAIILVAAGFVTIVFKKIGQPVVLGYLLAGFLVGPEITFIPTIQAKEDVKVWAEIGVIVLLFGLGLEFSFKKLAAVGKGATITAITEILAMLGIGYFTGTLFGWNTMDCIFLGGILSISSTTIIIRAFEELGFGQRRFASLVFGVLVVEDLIAILLMVLLSTIAVSKTFSGMQLAQEASRLAFFLTLWFICGIFVVPLILKKMRPFMNQETSLIVSLGLCFLMVVLATKLGFSPALGAFIMGSILAETPDGEKIHRIITPVKDLFAAIFFVSIGTLLEIKTLHEYWFAIVVICVITILGKLISTTLGSLISGQNLKTSVSTGMSLAQIGEFSFIIATLGMTLKVTSEFLYPIAVSVSAVTTFTTPYLIRSSDGVNNFLEKIIPNRWKSKLNGLNYEISNSLINPEIHNSYFKIFLNSVIIVAITLASSHWLLPFFNSQFGHKNFFTYLALGISILLSLPFLWGIMSIPIRWKQFSNIQHELPQYTTHALLSLIGRLLLSMFLLGFIITKFISVLISFIIVATLTIIIGLLGFKNFTKFYQWLENQFLSQLNEKEIEQLKNEKPKHTLVPWDAHMSELEVHANSVVVGKTLEELSLREKMGVTIALIERGDMQIMAPRRNTLLMPFDHVFVISVDEQIENLNMLFGSAINKDSVQNIDYGLDFFVLNEKNIFIGKTIRDSGLREAIDGLVVGIERQHKRILNPDSLTELIVNDKLWIVGNKKLIEKYK